ncbi:MAG TPA: NHL repeat-containing protein, partial [Verrucomicrobiae bacterium]|nr:NHL repeat-containing protein [Verrucomicrobiae bacterium]
MKSRTCRLAVATMAVALTASQGPAQSIYTPYTFTTLAGNAGYGTGSGNSFNYPNGVTVDSAGNLYVADSWNHAIRKVTPTGVVTTLAGLVLSVPHGVAVDSAGNLYVADTYNHTIRKLTAGGEVTTLAGLAGNAGSVDGTGSAARFKFPLGLAVDGVGNVFVADTSNSTIRKVTPAGLVTTLAGLADNNGYADATGTAARFNYPAGVAADSSGNVYVADAINHTIRKVTSTGVVTTLAGLAGGPGSVDGIANAARFNYPAGVALDSAGNLYVADEMNHTIRKVTPAGEVTTLAGLAGSNASADGAGRNARFYEPRGVAVDSAGNTYVADSNNHRIRKVTPTGEVTTLAGLPDGAGNVD